MNSSDVHHAERQSDQSQEVNQQENRSSENNTESEAANLRVCQEELIKWKEQCLRVGADFENFKKRTEREKANWIKIAQSNILLDLLSIVDDFDRALEEVHKKQMPDEFKVFILGFEMTSKSLNKLLSKYDVHEIKENTSFNPHLHEAVMQVTSPDHKPGDIVAVLQKGYLFKNEVLRPAKVSVAQ